MSSGVQTGNGTWHDKYNIRCIAHPHTNRKDDIFMQRRLVQNFTFILEWGKETCLLTKHTWRWPYSALQYFFYPIFFWMHNVFDPKIVWIPKFLRPQTFWTPTIFKQFFFNTKSFCRQNYFYKNCFEDFLNCFFRWLMISCGPNSVALHSFLGTKGLDPIFL